MPGEQRFEQRWDLIGSEIDARSPFVINIGLLDLHAIVAFVDVMIAAAPIGRRRHIDALAWLNLIHGRFEQCLYCVYFPLFHCFSPCLLSNYSGSMPCFRHSQIHLEISSAVFNILICWRNAAKLSSAPSIRQQGALM